ncbi:CRAL-TRIO domain-containing protein [Suillus occidentalis]|nr:CRAL-TRIO domain-containing protein [Suillus occidentalis]
MNINHNHIARSALEGNHKTLIDQYKTNLEDAYALQSTLNDEILVHVVQELALSDAEHAWAKEWTSDTATIFRFLRHHRFIRSFALEAMHTTLIWRLTALVQLLAMHTQASPLLHCLPPPICDPLGRPLVFLRLSELLICEETGTESVMDGLLISLERLRVHLRSLNDDEANCEITLQCVFLIDLEGLSIHSVNLDILTCFMKEVVPRYPGMLGAVFFLNYSWVYGVTWSIVKRILPKSAVARVFFPSREELLDYCSASALPSNYGGTLLPLHLVEDPLRPYEHTHHDHDHRARARASGSRVRGTFGLRGTTHQKPSPTSIPIPPRSALNPCYGYPTVASLAQPHMVHPTRRRKRDLLLTLLILWWKRWGARVFILFCFFLAVRFTRKRARWMFKLG